jgi:prepilin-type N-terminal cleavage/methylation domain-containing protein
MKTKTGYMNRAFTILELLIAVIIIGVLVAIITPVYQNRAEDARRAAAQSDLESLSKAQQHAAIDTGYFYRLYVLDDLRGDINNPPIELSERIDSEHLRTDVGNPTLLFIDSREGNLLLSGDDIYRRMQNDPVNFNWNGPYLNLSRKTGEFTAQQPYPEGLPMDPWGNPYLFFTQEGVLQERDRQGVFLEVYVAADGNSYDATVFDRPTILSLGPNGVPGNGAGPEESNFGEGDDLLRQF